MEQNLKDNIQARVWSQEENFARKRPSEYAYTWNTITPGYKTEWVSLIKDK